jgi:hypothetical protein
VVSSARNSLNVKSQKRDKRFRVFKDFIYPILLSFIAAIIFWTAFSYLPETARQNKIRPKLDLDMYSVYSNLFSILDMIMRPSEHSPSSFQQKIRSGKLAREDIELGLQDKCLNETYLYDTTISRVLQVTGKSLYDRASKIDVTVERIFNFSDYLSAEEILLLEKIRKQLQVHALGDYNSNAAVIIGGKELRPVNPSISYMSQNLFGLYQLFVQLQELVFNNDYTDRDISINKVQYQYYSGQYRKCENEIGKAITEYPRDRTFLEFYFFLCEYMSGRRNDAYLKLETILRDKPDLVSSRGFLEEVILDKNVKTVIEKHYTEKEIGELNTVLQREDLLEKSYIARARSLLKYYQDKTGKIRSKMGNADTTRSPGNNPYWQMLN